VDMSSVGSFDSEDEDGEAAGRLEVWVPGEEWR
jgi:hypothetical protein